MVKGKSNKRHGGANQALGIASIPYRASDPRLLTPAVGISSAF
jgi:hypothetical protein